MKKIWVTGSRGFIGKELVSFLKQNNNDVKCFTHHTKTEYELKEGLIYFNFLNEKDIKKLVKEFGIPDIFIHLGWASMTDSESVEHLNFNVKSSKNLIKNFFELGLKKFIFLGSRDEYGERDGMLEESMNEIGKISKYAKAKKTVAEFGFREAKNKNKNFIHIRLFNTYGPGQRENSLINLLYKNFHNNDVVHLGPCKHYRDYIHISEVCIGIKLICNINKSETINLGSGKAIKLKDFVMLFWEKLGGKEEKIVFESEEIRKNDPIHPKSFADQKKIMMLVNWVPTLDIEEGIMMTIRKMNENKKC